METHPYAVLTAGFVQGIMALREGHPLLPSGKRNTANDRRRPRVGVDQEEEEEEEADDAGEEPPRWSADNIVRSLRRHRRHRYRRHRCRRCARVHRSINCTLKHMYFKTHGPLKHMYFKTHGPAAVAVVGWQGGVMRVPLQAAPPVYPPSQRLDELAQRAMGGGSRGAGPVSAAIPADFAWA